jgi:hypothetical protein
MRGISRGQRGTDRADKTGMLTNKDELKDRVEARRHELMSKYNELKADTRHEAMGARDKIKAKLDEIESDLKAGWESMSEAVRVKLNAWLDRKDQNAADRAERSERAK